MSNQLDRLEDAIQLIFEKLNPLAVDMAIVKEKTSNIEKSIADTKTDHDSSEKDKKENYVTKDEFKPVKYAVFGIVSLVMTAFIGGLLNMMISNPDANAAVRVSIPSTITTPNNSH